MVIPKKRFSIKKVLGVVFVLIVGSLVFLYILGKSSVVKYNDLVKASDDQLELVKEFGYPDVFLLSMDETSRFEVWTYYTIGKQYSFLDGAYYLDNEIDILPDDEYEYTDFRPTQFGYKMDLKDSKKLLGDPTAEADGNLELTKGSKIYDFWDQAKAAISFDDHLVFIETLPIYNPKEYRPKE